jgi:predicted RNA binding protein YcfA (HicA-like mRNA interferase family)
MGRLPRIAGKEMVKLLERLGFRVARIHGSHHFMERGDQRTTVPVHGSRDLKIGTLRKILRDVGITPTEFENLWKT